MEHAIDINSEEELLGLKNEGKISDSEYSELLGAMRKPAPKAPESSDEGAFKEKYGRIAFYLMVAGVAVPTVVFLISLAITGGGEGDVIFSACSALCVLIELAAFVCGVVSWPDFYAKITVVTIAAVAVLVFVYMVLYPLLVAPQQNM